MDAKPSVGFPYAGMLGQLLPQELRNWTRLGLRSMGGIIACRACQIRPSAWSYRRRAVAPASSGVHAPKGRLGARRQVSQDDLLPRPALHFGLLITNSTARCAMIG
jgi:hypothetical protein